VVGSEPDEELNHEHKLIVSLLWHAQDVERTDGFLFLEDVFLMNTEITWHKGLSCSSALVHTHFE